MQPLDKYIVTNKRSKLYGHEVWVYKPTNKNGVAKFSDGKGNIVQFKESSVAFVAPRFSEGQTVTDGKHMFTIGNVHRSNLYYLVSYPDANQGWTRWTYRYPQYLSALKAVVI